MVYALTFDNRKGTLQNRELFVNNVTKCNPIGLVVSVDSVGWYHFPEAGSRKSYSLCAICAEPPATFNDGWWTSLLLDDWQGLARRL